MAAKKFNFQFEDIRRNSTPVAASTGFGDIPVEDPENPDEAFLEVDLNEEDAEKSVHAVDSTAKPNGAGKGADDADDEKERRRERLRAKRVADKAANEAITEARAEVAEEINTLHEKIDTLESGGKISKAEEEYDTAKADIEAKMVQAMEDGKSEEYAKLNSQLIELNGEFQEKKMALSKPHQAERPDDLDGGQAGGEQQPANPRAVEFIKTNEDWWVDPDNEDAVEYVRALDKKLIGMGYDPRSDRYWDSLHKRFDKKFPGLRLTGDDEDLDLEDDEETGGKRGNRSPVARPGAGGGASQGGRGGGNAGGGDGGGSGNKVRLTAADKANMVRFQLDPSNPEHCREYALNKVSDQAGA